MGGSMFVQWERSLTVSCYDRRKIEENIAEAKEEIREAEAEGQGLLLYHILVLKETSASIRTTVNCL